MSEVAKLVEQGGLVMVALIVLSIILYQRCLALLFFHIRLRRRLRRDPRPFAADNPAALRSMESVIEDRFAQQMRLIAALVAAAPLLGLLGTIIGMVHTFESLASDGRGRSIEGLAEGVSLALVTTETGLAIALPAMILIYFARRQMQILIHFIAERDVQP